MPPQKHGQANLEELREEWNEIYGDDIDGGCRDRYFDFWLSKIKELMAEEAGEIDKIITFRMREISNTPLADRKDAFNELSDCRSKILKERNLV